jgi:hypothetical protein
VLVVVCNSTRYARLSAIRPVADTVVAVVVVKAAVISMRTVVRQAVFCLFPSIFIAYI